MGRLEFNPSRLYVCVECGDWILEGCVYRLNENEVVCLRDYIEAFVCLSTARVYDQRTP
jgi:hypothetical protein